MHMGADLSRGQVVGDCLKCPFHEWSFGSDGGCVKIPASETIPDFARQTAYPTAVCGGHVFVFNRAQALFEMPFFDGVAPESLRPARPFEMTVEMNWSMVAANGFDLQHFRTAHDRTLRVEPAIESPSHFARRINAEFDVTGTSWRDQLTRRFSGPKVVMEVTSWCGTLVLVRASFLRTTSYGMVCVSPLTHNRAHLKTIVWVPRSRSTHGQIIIDPLDAMIRRSFIRAFMQSDQNRSAGIRYNPGALIDADHTLVEYFKWLNQTVQGESFQNAKGA